MHTVLTATYMSGVIGICNIYQYRRGEIRMESSQNLLLMQGTHQSYLALSAHVPSTLFICNPCLFHTVSLQSITNGIYRGVLYAICDALEADCVEKAEITYEQC